MPSLPDDRFPLPEDFGPGSVWADRTGHRTLVGRTQRGVEIPIGHGEGEASPGELLKLALIGCAGMSSDVNLARRLGEDFEARLWAHGTSDEAARHAQVWPDGEVLATPRPCRDTHDLNHLLDEARSRTDALLA